MSIYKWFKYLFSLLLLILKEWGLSITTRFAMRRRKKNRQIVDSSDILPWNSVLEYNIIPKSSIFNPFFSVLLTMLSTHLREESKTYAGGRRIPRAVAVSSQVLKGGGTKILRGFSKGGERFFTTFEGGLRFVRVKIGNPPPLLSICFWLVPNWYMGSSHYDIARYWQSEFTILCTRY